MFYSVLTFRQLYCAWVTSTIFQWTWTSSDHWPVCLLRCLWPADVPVVVAAVGTFAAVAALTKVEMSRMDISCPCSKCLDCQMSRHHLSSRWRADPTTGKHIFWLTYKFYSNWFFKKCANPGLFFVYFPSFQTNINTIFRAIQCEKCQFHPVYVARIRTHDFSIKSHLP